MVFENLTIEIFKTSHDTSDSRGFVITSGNSSLVYVTDTGYINQKYFKIMKNKNLEKSKIILEPISIKMLIIVILCLVLGSFISPIGIYTYTYMFKVIGGISSTFISELQQTDIILAHLSKENNTEEEALKTINEVFNEYQIPFNNIECAKQREKTKVVTI